MPRFTSLFAILCLSVGCDFSEAPDLAQQGSASTTPADLQLGQLEESGIELPEGFEPIESGVLLADLDADMVDEDDGLSPEALEDLAAADASWYSPSGERYEALLVLENGEAFGRLGTATEHEEPGPENNYGMNLGISDEEAFELALAHASLGEELSKTGGAEPGNTNVLAAETPVLPGILGDDLDDDRRTRPSEASMTNFPARTVGALNTTSSPGFTGCTGTLIGPRHVITASHCVLSSTGVWTTSGLWHPGQTRTAHPNAGGTAVAWSGVYARDWRVGREFEYAVLILEDRANVASMGWLGVAYWSGSSDYNGRNARILGYPSRSTSNAWQKCKASPFASDNCGGWMYRDQQNLTSSSFISSGELQYDIDTSSNQSGSTILTDVSSLGWVTLGIHYGCSSTTPWDGCSGSGLNRSSRFRTSMWNDVCSWITSTPSAHGTHSICN